MAQIALSTALLIGAGLFIRSLANVSRADLGIQTDNVVTFRLAPVLNGYEPHQIRSLYERVEEAVGAHPGVAAASAAAVPVFAGNSWGNNVMVEGYRAGPDTDRNSRVNIIGIHYFRTREMGLRMALGADGARLRNMVLGQVGRLTAVATCIGVVAAIGLERVARSLLYEMEGADPLVTAVVALGAVSLAAGFVPAYRASRIDPMRALRYE